MDMDSQPTTAPVLVELIGYEPVAGGGACTALAVVDVEIAGIGFQLQGVRVVKRGGGLVVEAPQFRHPRTGQHIPAVVLPPELAQAVAAAVLDAYREGATGLPGSGGAGTAARQRQGITG